MTSGIGESIGMPPQNPSCSGAGSNDVDAADFECNICFDLAQDPVVTLCGHLFCWPCLYKWLHHHSHSQECPVCKALIQEEKLVPIYGRGKESGDPRSKSIPGIEIPNHPTGQRPETAPPPEANPFLNIGFGLMGVPMATARFGNLALSAAFGGVFPSLFNIQVHGYPDATVYGTTSGFPYGFPTAFRGGHLHAHGVHQAMRQDRQRDSHLKTVLLIIGICAIMTLIWS